MSLQPSDLIHQAGDLASLPEVYFKVNEAVDNPEITFSEIADIIRGDSALSGRLLKIVNSSFYGFTNKIDTITHAITVIGTAQLRDLVLATKVVEKFNGIPLDTINMKSFWTHSIACGLVARILATYGRERNCEKFYVMGLLHDLGRLVMYLVLPNEMKTICDIASRENILLHDAEQKVLGFDHSRVGAELIGEWQLSSEFQNSIQECHSIVAGEGVSREGAILHISDIIIHGMGVGTSGDEHVSPLNSYAWDKVQIEVNTLETIVNLLDDQLDDAYNLLIN